MDPWLESTPVQLFALVVLVALGTFVGRRYRERLTRTQWMLIAAIGALLAIATVDMAVVGMFMTATGVTGAIATRRTA